LRVAVTVQACSVSQEVGDAFEGAVDEALRNVADHARTTAAALTLVAFDGQVVAEVSDRGRGFDPDAPPGHHFGVRESIVGRMSSIDGHASVKSAPGAGTVWTLEWRRDGD
jgi:signal transduction histidine kinase